MKKFSKEKQSSQLVNSANRDGRGFFKNRKKNQNKDDCQFHIKNNNYQHQEEQKKSLFRTFFATKNNLLLYNNYYP